MANDKKICVPLTGMELHALRLLLVSATREDPNDAFSAELLDKIQEYRHALTNVPAHARLIRKEMDTE